MDSNFAEVNVAPNFFGTESPWMDSGQIYQEGPSDAVVEHLLTKTCHL